MKSAEYLGNYPIIKNRWGIKFYFPNFIFNHFSWLESCGEPKMRLTILLLISIFLLGFQSSNNSNTYSVSITVTNIRNNKGMMQFQVYKDQATFAKESPYKIYRVSKSTVKDGKMKYTITGLPADTYGLALLDDENSNKKMDYGWVMPEEGFGFSDYYHTSWSRPVFNQFKFDLKSDKSVTMKVRYV